MSSEFWDSGYPRRRISASTSIGAVTAVGQKENALREVLQAAEALRELESTTASRPADTWRALDGCRHALVKAYGDSLGINMGGDVRTMTAEARTLATEAREKLARDAAALAELIAAVEALVKQIGAL